MYYSWIDVIYSKFLCFHAQTSLIKTFGVLKTANRNRVIGMCDVGKMNDIVAAHNEVS